ncbi:uncharacterized protein LOC120125454 [Hibiscus syriacus]|uniref:uncharacterized protein LOC120125454 n=1 Tax=Hibiscus syriacus TaxID=106335 RepID=UPI001920CAC8|nr:uncharacterized protein LOC120125454 [Hibiscus syriacus]
MRKETIIIGYLSRVFKFQNPNLLPKVKKNLQIFPFFSITPNNKHKYLETGIDNRRAEPELDSEEDLEELESDVNKMAEKILEYRSTIPDQLKATLASVLSSQRPNFPYVRSEPGSSGELNPDSEETKLGVRYSCLKRKSRVTFQQCRRL